MLPTLAVVSTTSVGLLVGVEFAVAVVVNPILRRLPVAASIAGRAHGARMLGRVMPFWYIGSTLLVAALAVLTWGSTTAVVALVAIGLLLLSVVLSVALLVPINNQAAQWTAESLPENWRELQQRWDRLHTARVGIIVVALVLVTVSATAL